MHSCFHSLLLANNNLEWTGQLENPMSLSQKKISSENLAVIHNVPAVMNEKALKISGST